LGLGLVMPLSCLVARVSQEMRSLPRILSALTLLGVLGVITGGVVGAVSAFMIAEGDSSKIKPIVPGDVLCRIWETWEPAYSSASGKRPRPRMASMNGSSNARCCLKSCFACRGRGGMTRRR
jgi:hypothetical protein